MLDPRHTRLMLQRRTQLVADSGSQLIAAQSPVGDFGASQLPYIHTYASTLADQTQTDARAALNSASAEPPSLAQLCSATPTTNSTLLAAARCIP
jgi:hypothetical protein